jgi:CubicO group peptidase (beta-lactamase class C family)
MHAIKSMFVVLVLAPLACAQTLVPPADAPAQIQKIFASFDHVDTPGCAVGVSLDDTVVYSAAYGMADLEHHVALTKDSVFEPGSITKQFTAAAVLLLAEDGKISIDDPVRKYLPELPEYESPITIRHLLNHTSGLRDWGSVLAVSGWPRFTRTNSNANVLDIAARQRSLNYAPGAAYSYTNTGYNLLAILVERVSGKTLPAFTRERIFVPLGMTSTQWRDDYRRIVPNRAIGYTQSDGAIRQDMPFENAYGNGGLLTTVGDLLRWNRNFTEMKVGGAGFIQAQVQQGRLNDGRTIAYAAGLEVLTYKGLREVSHSGSTAGYQAWLARYPDQRLSVAVLCSSTSANPTSMGHRVAEVYLASAMTKAVPPASVKVEPALLTEEAGLYRSDRDHSTVVVKLVDGQLQMAGHCCLRNTSAKQFVLDSSNAVNEFETSASGKVTGIRMESQVDGFHHYEKVGMGSPSRADLQSMVGQYVSNEAEVTLSVVIGPEGLTIHRRPDSVISLQPTYRDGFSSSLGTIRFFRDTAGKVTEMSISEDRLWDLRLKRVP